LKLWNSIMSGLLVAPLALVGCDNGDEDTTGAGTTEAGTTTTTTGDDTTSSTTAAVDSSSGATTEAPPDLPPVCAEPDTVIPKAPFDCSGADMVLTNTVVIEDGGDPPEILMGVRRVEGSVRINRIDATNLDFMGCLEEVTGDITIFGNEQLTNVDGLWSLTTIGTDFIFSENTALVDFNGLPNLEKIETNLVLKNNDAMEQINGFQSLAGVEGNLTIQNNNALLHVDGLLGVLVVNGVLAISANPMLCISSVNCVGMGIVQPEVPPDTWTTQGNDNGC
jgi:hypothetical protein